MEVKNGKKTASFSLGVDIGGSHITAAIVDLSNRCVVEETMERTIVDAHGKPEEILKSWCGTIREAKRKSSVPIRSIGIAMPGPFDYEGGVALIRDMNKYDSLFGVDVRQTLSRELSIEAKNILFKNDTEAFLEGEVLAGAARGYGSAVAITLGTGVGTARSINGCTQDMNLGSSSFNKGIAEDYLSTRWFVKRYHELTGRGVKGVKELVELGRENEPVRQIFHEFSGNLASFLIQLIRFEKPEVLVIGGNIAHAYDRFYPTTFRLLEKHLDAVKICKTTLGEKAALIGAVSHWIQNTPAG